MQIDPKLSCTLYSELGVHFVRNIHLPIKKQRVMSKKEMQETGLEKFSNFVIFQTKDGKVNIDVYFKDDTLWLTQKLISELFEKGRSTITEHLKAIFSDGELEEKVVCSILELTTQHGAIKERTV